MAADCGRNDGELDMDVAWSEACAPDSTARSIVIIMADDDDDDDKKENMTE